MVVNQGFSICLLAAAVFHLAFMQPVFPLVVRSRWIHLPQLPML